jgi:hypothetical protein
MSAQSNPPERPFNWPRFLLFVGVGALITAGIVALLVNIFERKQEARNPFYRVVELTDDTEDPAVWGKNFPAVRRLSPHGGSGAHPLRRQRSLAACPDES